MENATQQALSADELLAGTEAQSEAVLALPAGSQTVFALLRKLRGQRATSDTFRVQLRACMRQYGEDWQLLDGDDAKWYDTLNSAWVIADHDSRTLHFGPKGGIPVSETLAGHGLPAYLFAQTILWAKQRYPDYAVARILLHPDEAADEESRLRRNSFYASQGFDFEWFDHEQRAGCCFKGRADQLLAVWDLQTVRDLSCEALIGLVAEENTLRIEAQDARARMASHKEHLESRFERERMINLILTGVTCFVLTMGLMAALGV